MKRQHPQTEKICSLHKPTIISMYSQGLMTTASAARALLLCYWQLSVKRKRPCNVSMARIARDLEAPKAAVRQALTRWPCARRLGHNGQRRREWEVSFMGFPDKPESKKNENPRVSSSPKGSDQAIPRALGDEKALSESSINRRHLSASLVKSENPLMRPNQSDVSKQEPATFDQPPSEESINTHLDFLKPKHYNRKYCIHYATGLIYTAGNKIFDTILKLEPSAFLQACAYTAAWRWDRNATPDKAEAVLSDRFKIALS